MTVQQLIAKLQNYPGHLQVLVSGYESGFDHIDESEIGLFNVMCRQEGEPYLGEFEEYDANPFINEGRLKLEALIIPRYFFFIHL